jgi:hypothetical protein
MGAATTGAAAAMGAAASADGGTWFVVAAGWAVSVTTRGQGTQKGGSHRCRSRAGSTCP